MSVRRSYAAALLVALLAVLAPAVAQAVPNTQAVVLASDGGDDTHW